MKRGGVHGISVSSSGLAVACYDGNVRLFDAQGQPLYKLLLVKGRSGLPYYLAYSPDGALLAVTCSQTLFVVEVSTGAVLAPRRWPRIVGDKVFFGAANTHGENGVICFDWQSGVHLNTLRLQDGGQAMVPRLQEHPKGIVAWQPGSAPQPPITCALVFFSLPSLKKPYQSGFCSTNISRPSSSSAPLNSPAASM